MGILRPEDKEEAKTKRIYPATTKLSPKQREDLKKLSERYIQFIEKGVVSSFVVNEVVKLAQAKGYTNERSAEKPFYILGPDEKSFR